MMWRETRPSLTAKTIGLGYIYSTKSEMISSKLILPLVLIIVISECQSEYPSWPSTCPLRRYHAKKMFLSNQYEETNGVGTVDECDKMCREDGRCGMYQYSVETCKRYQMSVDMWKGLGLDEGDMWYSYYANFTSGSRTCKATTANTNCNYEYTAGKMPTAGELTYILSYSASLTDKRCETLCSLYSQCKSAGYSKKSGSDIYCQLYSTSLGGKDLECPATWSPCGTYQKKSCGEGNQQQPSGTEDVIDQLEREADEEEQG